MSSAAAAEGSAETAVALLDDDRIRIEHFPSAGESRTLVIAFDPLLYLWPKPPFGLDFLRKQGVHVIAVRRKEESFYQALDRARFERALAPLLPRFDRVVAYGSSLGAYAALYFCRDLDCEVISASPRVSVHPLYGVKAWQDRVAFNHQTFDCTVRPRCRATVFYDPREPTDRRYVESELLPQFPQAKVVRVPFAGHPSTQFLGDIGFIAPFVRAVVAGHEPPVLDRRQGRVRSAAYFQVMAELCARRGRLATADALIERSLALRSDNLLSQRTRGLVKTLQRDWPEAVAALERALAFDPNDRLTLAMLERARQGLASAGTPAAGIVGSTAAAAPTTAPAEPDSLAARALRWLEGRRGEG